MRSLVLGGTRFIGPHLVRKLLQRGHEVAALNRGRSKGELPPEVERLYADRYDRKAVRETLRDRWFDAVFDLSAYVPATLMPAVEALEGRVGRYVFCSTVSVYRPPLTLPIRETFPLVGGSPPQFEQYPLDKAACERYLAERGRIQGLAWTVLRPCIVYGPGNHHLEWEAQFFARLRRQRPVLMPEGGAQITHFVHVEDVAEAFIAATETGATIGQAYTVAGPEAISLEGYARLAARVVGVAPEIIRVPAALSPAQTSFTRPWPYNAVYSIEKARSQLGWNPQPMAQGMEESYRWYLSAGLDEREWDFSAEDETLLRLQAL